MGIPQGSLAVPTTLSSLCIQALDDSYIEPILEDMGITGASQGTTVPIVEVEIKGYSRTYDRAVTFLNRLDKSCSMRIEYYPARTYRHFSDIASELALSIESTDGIVRTVHCTESPFYRRASAFDDNHYFSQFRDFASLRCNSLLEITIAHLYLAALFAFSDLTSLRRLVIDLDVFEYPFWKTRATNNERDYKDGDRTPPPLPQDRRRSGSRGCGGEDPDDEDGMSSDDSGWPCEESIAESCRLLNTFDEEDEEYTVHCPVLDTVVLRTSYCPTRVHTRQLAHFGRALGLLDRPAEERPLLLLLGVELSSAKYGTLHLKVFNKVEKVVRPCFLGFAENLNLRFSHCLFQDSVLVTVQNIWVSAMFLSRLLAALTLT